MDAFLTKLFSILDSAAMLSAGFYGLFFFVAIWGAISDRNTNPNIFSSVLRYYHQSTSSPAIIFHIFFACVSLRFVVSLFSQDSFEIVIWTFFFFLAVLSWFSSFITSVSPTDYSDLEETTEDLAFEKLRPRRHKKESSLTQIVPRRKDRLLSRTEQNLARLERTVSDQLDLLEKDLPANRPSAKPIIMERLQPYLQHSTKEAQTWDDDFDYAATARTLIFNIAFDAISSGQYHLHAGVINPMTAGPNLLAITYRCLDWAVEHGHITEEEKETTLKTLRTNIKSVG